MTQQEKLLEEIKLEMEATLVDGKDYIEIINKELEKNLVAIYNAVTEIKLNDAESFKRVKYLVDKQECYKALRKDYLCNQTVTTGIKL